MTPSFKLFVIAVLLLLAAGAPREASAQRTVKAKQTKARPLPGRTRACPFCDLQGADLSRMDLSNMNLARADLTNANLTGARLDGAILIGAKLVGAKLDGASLGSTAKGPANLAGADLTNASFLQAKLVGTVLEHAVLTCTDFSGVDTTRALFGPVLRFDAATCKPKLRGAKLGCEFSAEWKRLDTSGVTLPSCKQAAQNASVTCGGNPPVQNLGTTVYVSTSGQDNGSCGTSVATACATIQTGIQQCGTNANCGVLVMYGSFSPPSTLNLANGVSLYGGCISGGSSTNTYQSLIQAPAGGVPTLSANGITQATTVQGFYLMGSQAGSGAQSSIAMLISNSSALTLALDQVVAGQGGTGNDGGNGGAGSGGSDANDSTGADNSSCSNANGGNGGPGMSVTINWVKKPSQAECVQGCTANNCSGFQGAPGSTGQFTNGGYVGEQECYACPFSKGSFTGTGGTGNAGVNGPCGNGGPASGNVSGTFNGSQWVANTGGAGASGGTGAGGGGGGGGGYCGYVNCVFKRDQYTGTTGGGGGSGGCGGGPGTGGQQGGASFAVVAISSTVTNGGNLIITSGSGGTGGTGGLGASGGTGGSGFTPSGADVCDGDGGNGGVGGNGGAGGAGGGGAGGNGGPAIGIALVSGATIGSTPSISFNQGASGSPGEPGQGGTPATSGACTGPNGNAGQAGTVADTFSF